MRTELRRFELMRTEIGLLWVVKAFGSGRVVDSGNGAAERAWARSRPPSSQE